MHQTILIIHNNMLYIGIIIAYILLRIYIITYKYTQCPIMKPQQGNVNLKPFLRGFNIAN
jgi:hypothetical protein